MATFNSPISNEVINKRCLEHMLNGLAMIIVGAMYFKKENDAFLYADQYVEAMNEYQRRYGVKFDHRGRDLFDPNWSKILDTPSSAPSKEAGHLAEVEARSTL